MDQLKPLDDIFLDLESPDVQANIGGVSVFEGPLPDYERFVRRIDSKLDLQPRYRQRLRFLPLRLGSPVWVDDPRFDIHSHLIAHSLEAPGDQAQLSAYYSEIISHHLPRNRPLWEIHLVDGLSGGRWAICWKVHHAMVDGLAAVELFSLLLDTERKAKQGPPSGWTPQPGPGSLSLVARTLLGADGPVKPLRDAVSAARHPRRTAGRGLETALTFMPIGRSLVSPHHSPLNGPIGSRRLWVTARADLESVKRIGRAHRATVNDVLVAAVANGLREHLIHRGERVEDYDARTMVPVSLRGDGGRGETDNQISAVFIELPVATGDPVDQLKAVSGQMRERKQAHGEVALESLLYLARYVPPPIFRLGEGLAWRLTGTERLMNTVTTNVPGPQTPFYCLGREMQSLYPYVLLPKNIRLTTAIFSYNGGVYFGVTADSESVPDAGVVARGIERALAELSERAPRAARRR